MGDVSVVLVEPGEDELPTMDESELDAKAKEEAEAGLAADLVLMYPIESIEELTAEYNKIEAPDQFTSCLSYIQGAKAAKKKKGLRREKKELRKRIKERAAVIVALREAGLRAIISQLDAKTMIVKVSAPKERLERQAEVRAIEMLVDDSVGSVAERSATRKPTRRTMNQSLQDLFRKYKFLRELYDNLLPSVEPRNYTDFTIEDQHEFKRKDGVLFSSLERQRLVYSVMESPRERGGAQLDLDRLKGEGIFSSFLFLHSHERKTFFRTWGRMDDLGGLLQGKIRMKIPDLYRLCLWLLQSVFYVLISAQVFKTARETDVVYGATLGALILVALWVGMLKTPMHELRDYFGEKVAFYFGWIEHYTRYLIYLTVFAIVAVSFGGSEVLSSEMDASNSWWKCVYCVVVALWTTLYAESWKRKTAVLAHIWDVSDFEAEEEPRPEFISSFYVGRWAAKAPKQDDDGDEDDDGDDGDGEEAAAARGEGSMDSVEEPETGSASCTLLAGEMREERGFFTSDRRFIRTDNKAAKEHKIFPFFYRLKVYSVGAPSLIGIMVLMISGTFGLFVFRFISDVNRGFQDDYPLLSNSAIPAIFSAAWITIMNMFYSGVAEKLNNLENYRTETEYSDNLIIKTAAFQFLNSFLTLIYIAFIKSQGLNLGGMLGAIGTDGNNDPIPDLCGTFPEWDAKDANGTLIREYATVPMNSSTTCDISATNKEDSGCAFIFVERDCSEDLRTLMIAYTVLKPCYEAILQCLPALLTMLYATYKAFKNTAAMLTLTNASSNVGSRIRSLSSGGGPGSFARSATKGHLASEIEAVETTTSVDKPAADDAASAPPSPPPSPPTPSANDPNVKQRLKFHGTISKERNFGAFAGTFAEYNTKVIQFGYIAMFSAAFPLAAIASAVANFNEMRLDAVKTLSSQRPRYQGAQDIGTWAVVLRVFAWLALPMNVGILVFTAWGFREHLLVPALFPDDCTDAIPLVVSTPGLADLTIPANHLIHPHAKWLGESTSFTSSCARNVNDCYARIGGVAWLPASQYFDPPENSVVTRAFTQGGLCDAKSSLFNELHCTQCEQWQSEVSWWQVLIFIFIEHLLVALKFFLGYIIPDTPMWVKDAAALKYFSATVKKEKKIHRASLGEGGEAELEQKRAQEAVERIKKEEALRPLLNQSEDGGVPIALSTNDTADAADQADQADGPTIGEKSTKFSDHV